MKLKLNNRFTKYINKIKDILIIELKKSDEMFKDIEFFGYVLNYKKDIQYINI